MAAGQQTSSAGQFKTSADIVPSDALVFFGATGDLAYKKIFPALQNMVRRESLTVPVVGVAKSGWTVEQLRARARVRASANTGEVWMRLRLANSCSGSSTLMGTIKTQPPTSS